MPRAARYALIPDGYSLTKVTKAEEQALKDLRKHDDFKTFLGSPQSGTAVGGVAVGAALLIFLIPIFKSFLSSLAEDPETKNKTIVQLAEEDADWKALLLKASIGVPQTLQQAVIPQPARDILTDIIGVNIFKPLEDLEKL
jgi:hypothetical protein